MALEFSPSEVAVYYAARAPKLKQSGAGWRGPCPIHKGQRDSFAVDPKTGQWNCHSTCGRGGDIISLETELSGNVDFAAVKSAVFDLVGRAGSLGGNRRIVATYGYCDETGTVLYQACRMEPKDFRQRRPDGKGDWVWSIKGVRLVPYRLPELLKRATETVFVCEGEKDVHSLEALGVLATCNPMGAGKWRREYSEALRGRPVVILPDNDVPGRKHAAFVAADLMSVGCEVRILQVPTGKDVSDWLGAGGTLQGLQALASEQAALTGEALAAWRMQWGLSKERTEQFAARVEAANEWPEPVPIQSELPPVEPFSEDLLPASFRPLVRDVAERMQVPMDYPAVMVLLCLAGVVNRRAIVQPKANDTGWVVVPNLWGGIIAPPGFMKSPVIQAVTRPLVQFQAEWQLAHEDALKHYEYDKEEYELRRAAWKEQFKANSKKKKASPDRPGDEPEEPKLRRLIVNDATFEALHRTMGENPAGILVVRDELTGWWSQLDRAGREGERAFCLSAWNGDTGHTIDRIARGTIHVEACCMSMLGGIQPGRLRSYLADALQDGPSNDGLIQRFQLMVWPDTEHGWEYVDRAPDAPSEALAAVVFRKLVELDAEHPMRFRFAPDAQELFIEWLAELEKKVRGDELHPALTSHLSKTGS